MKIFVGNISFNTSERDLQSEFEQYGPVTSTRIMTDRDTGRSRGFGFVEMENSEEAQVAIAALNASILGGRVLNVAKANPKASDYAGSGSRR